MFEAYNAAAVSTMPLVTGSRVRAVCNRTLTEDGRATERFQKAGAERISVEGSVCREQHRIPGGPVFFVQLFWISRQSQAKTIKNGVDRVFRSRLLIRPLRPVGPGSHLAAPTPFPFPAGQTFLRVLPDSTPFFVSQPGSLPLWSRCCGRLSCAGTIGLLLPQILHCSSQSSRRHPFLRSLRVWYWRYLPCVSLPVFSLLRRLSV